MAEQVLMRGFPVVALMIMLSSAAFAQAPSGTPPTASAAADGISRDDYIAKARDAASKRAATRFDAMDADHDGLLTKDEIATYRAAHARKKPTEPQ